VVTGDGRAGWEDAAPYDRIIVTASTGTVHRAWFDQLVPGGLLQLPFHLEGPDLQAVVTLRKEDGHFRSVDVVDGGFMVLRDPAQREQGAFRGSSLSVTEHIEGEHRALGSLSGDGLRRLRPSARRRLAALLLETPRMSSEREPRSPATPGTPLDTRSPALYVGLARPPRAVVVRYHRSGLEQTKQWAVGVATLDGRSLSVVTFTGGGRRRLESYGDAQAEDILGRLLADWRSRGRPGTADLRVTVTYGDDGTPRNQLAWPQSVPNGRGARRPSGAVR
jgi:protein-L-isoaspartate(D-aspartate) O-methyltransferase